MRKVIVGASIGAVVTIGAVWAVLSWPNHRPDPDLLGKLAPAESYFYLSIPNDPERGEEFKRSHLHRLVYHPEVQKFIEPIEKQVRDLLKQDDTVTKTTGLTVEEICSLLGGPLGMVVFDAPVQSRPMPNVAISISAEDGAKLKAAAEKVRKKLGSEPGWETKEAVVHGKTVTSIGQEPMGFHYTLIDRSVILSPSMAHLEILLAQLEKGGQGLLASTPYKSLRKELAREDRALVTAYVGAKSLWGRFGGAIPPDVDRIVEATGIKDISALGFSMEYDLPQIRERYAVLTERQDRGLLRLIAGSPREDKSLGLVPKDASSYVHGSLSLAELYDMVADATKASPEASKEFESAMKEFETRVGLNLRKDLLGKMGSAWTFYSRGTAVPGQTEVVAIVPLEDSKGFFAAVDKLFADGEVKVERGEYNGQPLRAIALSGKGAAPEGLPLELPHSFEGQSVVLFSADGRLFAGLTADSPAKFAARVSKKGPSIRENPRFAEVLAKVPKEVDFVALADIGDSVGSSLGALNALPPEAMSALQDPKTGKSFLAPDRIPKAEMLKELIGVSATFKRTERNAIVIESISDVGGMSTSGLVGAGVAAAFIVPSISKATERAKITSCANNLSQLWKLQCVYASQFGSKAKKMPSETGGAFWLALTKTKPPLVDETEADIFVCPFGRQAARAGFTSYRGPRVDVSKLKDNDPVGCCEPGCHPNGSINVLLKSGTVLEANPGDELYKKALAGTQR